MLSLLANTIYDIYRRFVSCFTNKNNNTNDFKNTNNLTITHNEYNTLPDYEPMNEMRNLNKLSIQIPKYQFVFLEDD